MRTVFMVTFYWSYTVFVLLQELDIYRFKEKSIQIILMMKNTVNSTVKYIKLQFKIAVFYANI